MNRLGCLDNTFPQSRGEFIQQAAKRARLPQSLFDAPLYWILSQFALIFAGTKAGAEAFSPGPFI